MPRDDEFINDSCFEPEDLDYEQQKKNYDLLINLFTIRNDDYQWRVDNRGKYAWGIWTILLLQNLFVFFAVLYSLHLGNLEKHEWLYSTFFIALMGNSYFTINLVIKWLFSEIQYHKHYNPDKE
ncbi:MAG: hypothetical protein VX777_00860 [Chlamydiota bacterium]|nr:hypothetical protein [Chlamydiota bacterium]